MIQKASTHATTKISDRYRYGNPFDLDDDKAYRVWRENKLDDYPEKIEDLIVEINNPAVLSRAEFNAIHALVAKTNMAIYAGKTGNNPDKDIPVKFGEQFGLTELDDNAGSEEGVTSLTVVSGDWRDAYIPYTNKPIHWHTDGYYNSLNQQIGALFLHCVTPAASGGENALLDHELAYIHLRDYNPDFIRVLSMGDAMTIPANINHGKELRPQRSGPVFSVMSDGHLHMRYTARTHSIEWKDDAVTQAALKVLTEYLHSSSTYIYRATLQPGQGLVSNNVLHDRSGFEDNDENKRLLYRLRYFSRTGAT